MSIQETDSEANDKSTSVDTIGSKELRITLRDDRSSGSPTSLDKAEKISRIAAAVAIPVVLAFGGWVVQRTISSQTISQEYVKIAVSILQAKDSDPSLRSWATNLLSERSPTPHYNRSENSTWKR
jgi:hypothetical protein